MVSCVGAFEVSCAFELLTSVFFAKASVWSEVYDGSESMGSECSSFLDFFVDLVCTSKELFICLTFRESIGNLMLTRKNFS